jgi:hypothetical protein
MRSVLVGRDHELALMRVRHVVARSCSAKLSLVFAKWSTYASSVRPSTHCI